MSLTSEFVSQPLVFAQKYPIAPPHGVEHQIQIENVKKDGFRTITMDYKGERATTLDPAGHPTTLDFIGYSRVMKAHKVAYIEMFADARDAAAFNSEGKGTVRMRSGFTPFGEAEPVYFLPWDDRGYIVRLRIPKKRAAGLDPSIFFTATINGCSVFIQGDPDSPTVYHAGGPTGIKDPNAAARMWRHALINHIKSSASAQQRGKIQAEVNKTQYINTPGTKGDSSTPVAEEYERQMKALLDKKGSFQITQVLPWGCVFGVRTNDTWEFYLQENATVYCNYISRKDVRTVQYARPISLSKIYPGGSSRIATMSHQVPVTIS